MRHLAVLAALLLATTAHAETPAWRPAPGDAFVLTLERTSEGSTGSSFDRWTMNERIVEGREDGLVLEFDLDDSATADDRDREWQYPVRVLKPVEGPFRLLNREELERRVDAWLKAAGLPREACGRWMFTWTAYQIQCDPQDAVEAVALLDLDINGLEEGALFQAPGTLEPAPLHRREGPAGAVSFTVELRMDPQTWRRERAEVDVVVAEITGRRLTLDEALAAHAQDEVSGTMTITFELDPSGAVMRRTKVTRLDVRAANGEAETTTTHEVLVRRRKT
jgi:hypothetical protein